MKRLLLVLSFAAAQSYTMLAPRVTLRLARPLAAQFCSQTTQLSKLRNIARSAGECALIGYGTAGALFTGGYLKASEDQGLSTKEALQELQKTYPEHNIKYDYTKFIMQCCLMSIIEFPLLTIRIINHNTINSSFINQLDYTPTSMCKYAPFFNQVPRTKQREDAKSNK